MIFLLPSEAGFVKQLERDQIPLVEMTLEQVLQKLLKYVFIYTNYCTLYIVGDVYNYACIDSQAYWHRRCLMVGRRDLTSIAVRDALVKILIPVVQFGSDLQKEEIL